MRILCIDPGPVVSGAVLVSVWASRTPRVLQIWKEEKTLAIMEHMAALEFDLCLIEMIASYGMAVGAEVFETCVMIGRLLERAAPIPVERMTRMQVKMAICHSTRAKDANIRRAILDMYPASGGGKTPQVGTKGKPGPLFGMAKHAWPALALAIAWQSIQEEASHA